MTDRRTLSRRTFLGAAAGGAAAVGAAGLAASGGFDALATVVAGSPEAAAKGTYPFAGTHQAGIVTPAQDRMYTAAFDLTAGVRDPSGTGTSRYRTALRSPSPVGVRTVALGTTWHRGAPMAGAAAR